MRNGKFCNNAALIKQNIVISLSTITVYTMIPNQILKLCIFYLIQKCVSKGLFASEENLKKF